MIMLYFLLAFSFVIIITLLWYTRKIVQKLSYGVDNIDQLQTLLEEYCQTLEAMLEMDQYYGDETMIAAVKNTRLVIETCKVYKKTIMEQQEETMSANNETTETVAG